MLARFASCFSSAALSTSSALVSATAVVSDVSSPSRAISLHESFTMVSPYISLGTTVIGGVITASVLGTYTIMKKFSVAEAKQAAAVAAAALEQERMHSERDKIAAAAALEQERRQSALSLQIQKVAIDHKMVLDFFFHGDYASIREQLAAPKPSPPASAPTSVSVPTAALAAPKLK